MIYEEVAMGDVQAWAKGTRNAFQEAYKLYEKGKIMIDEHDIKMSELAREKVLNQERKIREEERREMWEEERREM